MNSHPHRSPVTRVSMEWYLANVTCSVDESPECSHCGGYLTLFEYPIGNCGPCSSQGIDYIPVSDMDSLFARKYEDIPEWQLMEFSEGIEKPICIVITPTGFMQGNGNHRAAFAFYNDLDSINAIFVTNRDYMHSDATGY